MTRMWDDVALRETLRRIEADTPEVGPELSLLVLDRLADEPVPSRSVLAVIRARAVDLAGWVRARIVRLVAITAALIVGLTVSPVGAQVADWFDFHGVLVSPGRDDSGDETPSVPPADRRLTLDRAAELVGFPPLVPTALGAPDAVEVSRDRRVVSMSWGSGRGTVRLDQFDEQLAPEFHKSSDDVRWVRVGLREALWFPTPHHLVLVGDPGEQTTVPPRLAGRTLVWVVDGVTLRLEGRFSVAEATALAQTVR